MARATASTRRVRIAQQSKHATRKALGIPIAQFLIDVFGMRRRFSAVSIIKGKNSTFSVVDLCVGILAIIILECERLSHVDDQFGRELILAHELGLKRFFSQSPRRTPGSSISFKDGIPRNCAGFMKGCCRILGLR